MRDYEDFELWISAEGEGGGYRVRASGAGETQRFELDAVALAERWERLKAAFAGQVRVKPEEIKDAETLGGELYRAIFADRIAIAWGAALSRVATKGKRAGVRLVLHVQEAGPLAGLPWELLFESHNRGPLAISPKTPILRCPDVQERPRTLAQAPPLRVLGVLAEPLGGQPPLDLEGEWQEIEKAVAPFCGRSLIEVERLVSPNLPSLRERLKREPAIHAIHFAGHGIAGALDLEKEGRIRRAEPALGQQLATLLDDAPELRLVVINACEGASGAGGESTASLAFHLARRGLPAVVALQSAIGDVSARLFAQKLYQELAKGNPLELAVTEAREALHDSHRGLAWAAPVLYLYAPTGEVFLQEEAPAPEIRNLLLVRSRKTRGILLGAAVLTIGILVAAIAGKRIYEDLTRKPPALRNLPEHALTPPPSSPRCPSPRGLEFSFVEIPAGPFTMGAPANRGDRTEERPQHPVEITKSYCVGAFEVTEAQFDAVLAGRDAMTKPQVDLPKAGVSWDETQTFVVRLNERDPEGEYRLLTEAELEHSSRAGSLGANVNGDGKGDLAHDANCRGVEDGFPKLAPIGSFRPNNWGLYDVQGNLQEWVSDRYGVYSPSSEPQIDPKGPLTGTDRVRRGGSFDMNPKNCALWSRGHSKPDYHSNDFGFRIARSLKYNPAQ